MAEKSTKGASTSTGGAAALRNTGAATGGAVTITLSGSSSTDTSTETSTGSKSGGKAADKGAPAKAAADRPNVYNITVNSTGKSGDAVDNSDKPGEDVKTPDANIKAPTMIRSKQELALNELTKKMG